jgi:hypothetical protein
VRRLQECRIVAIDDEHTIGVGGSRKAVRRPAGRDGCVVVEWRIEAAGEVGDTEDRIGGRRQADGVDCRPVEFLYGNIDRRFR